MHFWIDKRNQGYGLNRRHLVPHSLSGYGHNHQRYLRSALHHHKPMVTPVHRFQSISLAHDGARHNRRPNSPNYRSSPCSDTAPHSTNQFNERSQQELTSPSDICNEQMKCKLLFVIVCICFMIIAKFWIGITMRWEAVGFCFLISFFLVCRMLGVLYRSAIQEDWRSNVSSYQERRLEAYRARHSDAGQNEMIGERPLGPCPTEVHVVTVPTASLSEEPPPPYHIAQSMPSRNEEVNRNTPESPPPSYEKASI